MTQQETKRDVGQQEYRQEYRRDLGQQGICLAFGIVAALFTRFALWLAYQPFPAIVCGSIAAAAGFVLMLSQNKVSTLASFSLIPLGLVIMVYGMNTWPLLSFGERFTESVLEVYFVGYFMFALFHGLVFFGEVIQRMRK